MMFGGVDLFQFAYPFHRLAFQSAATNGVYRNLGEDDNASVVHQLYDAIDIFRIIVLFV